MVQTRLVFVVLGVLQNLPQRLVAPAACGGYQQDRGYYEYYDVPFQFHVVPPPLFDGYNEVDILKFFD